MAWCRALGTNCLPGKSRGGTPRGERAPQSAPRAASAGLDDASLGVPLPLCLRPGSGTTETQEWHGGEAVRKMVGWKNSRANKKRAARMRTLTRNPHPELAAQRPSKGEAEALGPAS